MASAFPFLVPLACSRAHLSCTANRAPVCGMRSPVRIGNLSKRPGAFSSALRARVSDRCATPPYGTGVAANHRAPAFSLDPARRMMKKEPTAGGVRFPGPLRITDSLAHGGEQANGDPHAGALSISAASAGLCTGRDDRALPGSAECRVPGRPMPHPYRLTGASGTLDSKLGSLTLQLQPLLASIAGLRGGGCRPRACAGTAPPNRFASS